MACEEEKNEYAAALVAEVAACLTVETGIGVFACAAAVYAAYNAGVRLDECLTKNGQASIQAELYQMYAEAQLLEQMAQAAGLTA
ncbi:MAG: hypothetical protein QOD72_1899 [Acidimicrobiaceae bacterium]|jgi:hypothetical protein|nr:hypothetical protein [Acidimicrobiaceae bacterium]